MQTRCFVSILSFVRFSHSIGWRWQIVFDAKCRRSYLPFQSRVKSAFMTNSGIWSSEADFAVSRNNNRGETRAEFAFSVSISLRRRVPKGPSFLRPIWYRWEQCIYPSLCWWGSLFVLKMDISQVKRTHHFQWVWRFISLFGGFHIQNVWYGHCDMCAKMLNTTPSSWRDVARSSLIPSIDVFAHLN